MSVAKENTQNGGLLGSIRVETLSLWSNPASFGLKLWVVEEVKAQ
jgi:hypothetical protein